MTDPVVHIAVVRQRLPAPPDVVFDEWTDAARLAEWMCPRPARCLNVEAAARIGGTLGFDIEEPVQHVPHRAPPLNSAGSLHPRIR